MGDGGDPAHCSAAGRIEAGSEPPDLDHCLLCDVLGQGGIAHYPPGQTENRRCYLLVQRLEGSAIAPADQDEQVIDGGCRTVCHDMEAAARPHVA
jgi:hypothetical protein